MELVRHLPIYNWLIRVFFFVRNSFGRNRFQVPRTNTCVFTYARLERNHIKMVGCRNTIECARDSSLSRCRIKIEGSDNHLVIESDAALNSLLLTVKGDGNFLTIGKSCVFRADTGTEVRYSLSGNSNAVHVGDACQWLDSNLGILGSSNNMVVGKNTYLAHLGVFMEDDGNEVYIGDGTTIYGKTELAVIESTVIRIGPDCMFSGDIHFRTGDSHSIVETSNGRRINASKDILLGSHVWVGTRAIVLKGAVVKDNCIVGAGSLLSKPIEQSHCAIAGNPARIIKSGVDWRRERI